MTIGKKTNLVEDLRPNKFHQNRFIGCEEVEIVSAYQRPGRPSWITDRYKKYKQRRGRSILASCQGLSRSIQRLQKNRKF